MSIRENTEVFTLLYPEADEFTRKQLKVFWTADEIEVEKDVHDILTNFTEAERHGVFTTLKLFTLYELRAGAEYWTGRFMKTFPRHEMATMGATFGMFELAVHKPFYNKINELLNATDPTFYTNYVDVPVLKQRMEFIDSIVDHPNDLVSLGGFSLVEGVILYSSFAFLKHFQSLGKNKLTNVVAGINFSVRDENIHAQAGAWTYNVLKKEEAPTKEELLKIEDKIRDMAAVVYSHESKIIDMIFEKGVIEGIEAFEMRLFVASRIDHCLSKLGIAPLYGNVGSPIDEWFYKGINNYQFNDFFRGQGREYTRNWNERKFVWG